LAPQHLISYTTENLHTIAELAYILCIIESTALTFTYLISGKIRPSCADHSLAAAASSRKSGHLQPQLQRGTCGQGHGASNREFQWPKPKINRKHLTLSTMPSCLKSRITTREEELRTGWIL